jgi:hypothetical protein
MLPEQTSGRTQTANLGFETPSGSLHGAGFGSLSSFGSSATSRAGAAPAAEDERANKERMRVPRSSEGMIPVRTLQADQQDSSDLAGRGRLPASSRLQTRGSAPLLAP